MQANFHLSVFHLYFFITIIKLDILVHDMAMTKK